MLATYVFRDTLVEFRQRIDQHCFAFASAMIQVQDDQNWLYYAVSWQVQYPRDHACFAQLPRRKPNLFARPHPDVILCRCW